MAKSLRSKRKKKLRAAKRLKMKPKLDQKLKETLMTESTEEISDRPKSIGHVLQESNSISDNEASTNELPPVTSAIDDDVEMESSNLSGHTGSKKNAKVPLHLLSQRKARRIQIKRKNKSKKIKNRIFKW